MIYSGSLSHQLALMSSVLRKIQLLYCLFTIVARIVDNI